MTSRDFRPSGMPYNNGVPNPVQCELWHWNEHGKHIRCGSYATVESKIPGRLPMHTCTECHQLRLKESKHDH